MKVAQYRAYGGPEQIEIADRPDPIPAEGQLLVAVRASSVNPVDWKIASGEFPFNLMSPGLPYVPGHDVAGVVLKAAGSFREGDRVFSRIPGTKGGTSAEKVAFAQDAAAKIPEGMSDHDAAAIPLAALTALQGLRDDARLPMTGAEGRRVLVVGASGGVGHFGVQIAKAAGAHVTGVCSGRNAEMVEGLGADAVIDYGKTSAYNEGGDYDVILDCVGHDPVGRFTPWLKPGGVYASTLPNPGVILRQIGYTLIGRRRVRGVMIHPSGDDLRFLAGLYTEKKLRVVIDEVFPLEKTADAHRKSIGGRARGKIVVAVSEG
jgi:NADPH:quinone reductase-like Zn-dependent oxidoreductase